MIDRMRQVAIIRVDCRRRHRMARRLHAMGWPPYRIASTLGMPRRRVDTVLRDSDQWALHFARPAGMEARA